MGARQRTQANTHFSSAKPHILSGSAAQVITVCVLCNAVSANPEALLKVDLYCSAQTRHMCTTCDDRNHSNTNCCGSQLQQRHVGLQQLSQPKALLVPVALHLPRSAWCIKTSLTLLSFPACTNGDHALLFNSRLLPPPPQHSRRVVAPTTAVDEHTLNVQCFSKAQYAKPNMHNQLQAPAFAAAVLYPNTATTDDQPQHNCCS